MKGRILVVDDERSIRDILAQVLGYEGYEVVCAASGGEALSMYRAQPCDLVLLDVKMQGIDGIDTLNQLPVIWKWTAVVIPDAYLSHLADATEPTLFCNVSIRFMLSWTFIEHHHHQRFNADIKNYQANFANNPEQIQRWLKATRSDTLVVIDVHPGTKFYWKTDEYVDLTALKQVLSQHPAFTPTQQWELPDGITITLWKKT